MKIKGKASKNISAEKQEIGGWVSNIVERLANNLQKEFPGLGGFPRANIFNMRAFYAVYEKVAQAARQLAVVKKEIIPANVVREIES